MNIATALSNYLLGFTGTTLGQTLFIGEAPSSNKVADDIWWVVQNGGGVVQKNVTGEAEKNYQFSIYCRSRDYGAIYTALSDLEEDLNCESCETLTGFETIDIEATTFPIDDDLDNEDRKIGLLQLTITTYKEC